jgi:hypothetical protein
MNKKPSPESQLDGKVVSDAPQTSRERRALFRARRSHPPISAVT